MRSAHRRARWVLATAGSFTLALSSLAQTKPASEVKVVPEKAAPEKIAAEPEVSPAVGRLVEIKVELAWLGNPATFPCQLAARKVGCKLEVGGFVPNEFLRMKAIEIARANSELPVVDKLLINANSAMVIAKATHEELSKAAAAVLGRTLAKHAEPFSFETDPSGEITITGLIPTWEDKLTVSRRLSQLPGCTGVVNNFRVRNQMRDGKPCNLVSLDGKLCVPAPANAVVDNSAPKPPAFPEAVQRVEVVGTVPLLPTEAPSAVAKGPNILPPTPYVSGPVASKPVAAPAVANAPVLMPSVQSKPLAPAPIASKPVVPATVVLKKDATPVVAGNSPTAANSGLNSAPLKLSSPMVLGNNSTAKPSSTVVNVVASPTLTSQPVATATPVKLAGSAYSMQLGNPARNVAPTASPIQQVGYQEPAGINRVVNTPASQPASSPYGGSPYGRSPYGSSSSSTPASSSPYSNGASNSSTSNAGTRTAGSNPYGGSPYGVACSTPAAAPAPAPAPVARVIAPATVPVARVTAPASPTVVQVSASVPVNQPIQVVQAAPVTTSLTRPATMIPSAPVMTPAAPVVTPAPITTAIPAEKPVGPKFENQVPAVLPSSVVSGPVVPAVKPTPAPAAKPVTASAVVPVSAKRPAATPAVASATSPEVQGFLRSRIEQIAQGKVRDVRVQGTSSNACVISLTVANSTDGQQIGGKIINMAELVPYKVDLQVRVQP